MRWRGGLHKTQCMMEVQYIYAKLVTDATTNKPSICIYIDIIRPINTSRRLSPVYILYRHLYAVWQRNISCVRYSNKYSKSHIISYSYLFVHFFSHLIELASKSLRNNQKKNGVNNFFAVTKSDRVTYWFHPEGKSTTVPIFT